MFNEMDTNWLQGQQHRKSKSVGDCRKSPKQTATISDDKIGGKAENAGMLAVIASQADYVMKFCVTHGRQNSKKKKKNKRSEERKAYTRIHGK